jgi:hypothetical protein
MSNLIIPRHLAQDRAIPDWFTRGLHDIDPSLIVYFNHLRGRWIIDRCTAGGEKHTANHAHTAQCTTTNVRVVQDEAGEYMPLCPDVLDWLRAHDCWNQTKTAEQLVTELRNKDEAYQEKLKQDRRDNTHHRTMDNKRQLLKMKHLMDQHNLEVNQ